MEANKFIRKKGKDKTGNLGIFDGMERFSLLYIN